MAKVFLCLILLFAAATSNTIGVDKDILTTFILTESKVQFDQGVRACRTFGPEWVPVSILTEGKNREVKRFVAANAIESLWTSGTDIYQQRNEYNWYPSADGEVETPFPFYDWIYGAPLNDASCRCVAVIAGAAGSCGAQSCLGWTVEPCDTKRQVICEQSVRNCEQP